MMIPAEPKCVSCGYDLSGVAREHDAVVCPECGSVFDPDNPFALKPWPNPLVMGAALALPVGAACAVRWALVRLAAGGQSPIGAWVDSIAVPAAGWLMVLSWVVWPGVYTHRIVRRSAHPDERRILAAALYLSGVGLGVVAVVSVTLIMFALGFIHAAG